MPDLSHDRQRAEMDSMMFKMVNAVMRDTNVQRAFIQNPEFSDLLLKLKQGPRSLPSSAPLGPFEMNEVPVSEPRTHMRTLEGHTLVSNGPCVGRSTRPQNCPSAEALPSTECSLNHAKCSMNRAKCSLNQAECSLNQEGHIAHFARQFPKADHHDEVVEDAFMQFSEKLVDGVGSLIHKLADSCRKVLVHNSNKNNCHRDHAYAGQTEQFYTYIYNIYIRVLLVLTDRVSQGACA
jgi:hypothetical protein